VRQAILDPGAAAPAEERLPRASSGFREYLVVHVVTGGGGTITGLRVNEDPFTIQLRDASGAFHSFDKGTLRVLERHAEKSLMPSSRSTLSGDEVEDLVAYLASLRQRP